MEKKDKKSRFRRFPPNLGNFLRFDDHFRAKFGRNLGAGCAQVGRKGLGLGLGLGLASAQHKLGRPGLKIKILSLRAIGRISPAVAEGAKRQLVRQTLRVLHLCGKGCDHLGVPLRQELHSSDLISVLDELQQCFPAATGHHV